MNDVSLSLILPTRGRVQGALKTLDSISHSVSQPDALEVVLYVDDDDPPSHQIDHPDLNIQLLIGTRRRMGEMYDTVYPLLRGRYIGLVNDDVLFCTPGWDNEIRDAFGRLPDDIGLIWGNDLLGGGPAHPFVSRACCEVLGGICPTDYFHHYIDTHLYDVFKQLASLGHERRCYLPEVAIEHCHHLVGKSSFDATYDKTSQLDDEWIYLAWAEERSSSARTLARLIENARR